MTLVVDQITKTMALDRLVPGQPEPLFWTLQLNLTRNTGTAFSLGDGLGRYIGVVVVAVVIGLVITSRHITSTAGAVALGAVLGGAVGNLVDRVARADDGFMSGGVVDFIDLQWWPIFNVADAAIVVGGIALAIIASREQGL